MWKSCDGASKLVFLKFHQVGGGFVLSFIDALLKIFVHKHKQYPALRELARNRDDSVIISHVSSYEEVRTWIESDNQVPIGTCALTVLRDPGERMVDTFFKKWFETVRADLACLRTPAAADAVRVRLVYARTTTWAMPIKWRRSLAKTSGSTRPCT